MSGWHRLDGEWNLTRGKRMPLKYQFAIIGIVLACVGFWAAVIWWLL